MLDLSPTIISKSDQLNADDLISGPIIIKITRVASTSAEQPIAICYEGGEKKPFLPCKTVRRILVAAWGKNGESYVGKSMQIHRDPTVMYAGVQVGGIRVSKLSDISEELQVAVRITRGKMAVVKIAPLVVENPKSENFNFINIDGEVINCSTQAEWFTAIKSQLNTDIENQDKDAFEHSVALAKVYYNLLGEDDKKTLTSIIKGAAF